MASLGKELMTKRDKVDLINNMDKRFRQLAATILFSCVIFVILIVS
jgi:hypothetical protein